ncbi:hypothetical protein TIFTF001_015459 [Ficus carica]|uniref:Uncharacterized protein n=1 Tax=Ficus carica TaxID=3494 RepID=A0AA88D7W0_FICCA|nr:hypothetical protein TIFTF001_015459 [Ficus carica]
MNTSGVSAYGTLMLKSVVVLVSKQRGRALARKNYPYLNRWANPLFIGVPRGLRCSGDSVGLNSECSRQVDMLQSGQAAGAGDRTGIAVGGVRCQAADAECRVGVLLSACTGWHDAGIKGPTEQVCSTVVVKMPSWPITRAPTLLRP